MLIMDDFHVIQLRKDENTKHPILHAITEKHGVKEFGLALDSCDCRVLLGLAILGGGISSFPKQDFDDIGTKFIRLIEFLETLEE